MDEVKLEMVGDVQKALAELGKISTAFKKVETDLATTIENSNKKLDDSFGKTEKRLNSLANLAKNAGNTMLRSFQSLIDIAAVAGGFKFGQQLSKSISETVALSDAVRKLGNSFGITEKERTKFQASIAKDLGKYGLSSEDAAKGLQGLAGQGVTGASTVSAYVTRGAQLSSISGGDDTAAITKGLANVVRARGASVQDTKALDEIASVVTKAIETTGKNASEILASMEASFSNMTEEMKEVVSAKGIAQVATAASVAGPGIEGLFDRITSAGLGEKERQKAFGLDKLIDKQGNVNLEALTTIEKNIQELAKSVGVTKAAEIVGGDEAAGKALMQLIKNSERVSERFKALDKASGDVGEVQKKNRGLLESVNANFNKFKGGIADFGASATQGITDFFTGTAESEAGAAGVTIGGSAIAAGATLAGAQGIAGAVLGTGATGAGAAATGALAAGALPLAAGAGLVGAGYMGYKAMSTAEGRQAMATGGAGLGGDTKSDALGNAIMELAGAIRGWTQQSKKPVKVEMNSRDLREAKQPTRGASQ